MYIFTFVFVFCYWNFRYLQQSTFKIIAEIQSDHCKHWLHFTGFAESLVENTVVRTPTFCWTNSLAKGFDYCTFVFTEDQTKSTPEKLPSKHSLHLYFFLTNSNTCKFSFINIKQTLRFSIPFTKQKSINNLMLDIFVDITESPHFQSLKSISFLVFCG